MNSPIEIGNLQLGLALGFVLVTGASSLFLKLGLMRDLAIGTLRTFGQLFLMGWVLTFVFKADLFVLVALVFVVMVSSAAHIIRGRVKEKTVPFGMPLLASMFVSFAVVSLTVTGVIVQASPWWMPEYFIPLSGMVIGNSMNAIAIALDRLFSDLRAKRDSVEMRLALGADFREASREAMRDALRAGMIPSINSMMGVGLVFIPGMMTGQILAGAEPLSAIRYQIVVMLMLTGSTALGTLLAIHLVRRRCFGPGQALVLPRGNGQSL